jgi:serine/threonine protein kinase
MSVGEVAGGDALRNLCFNDTVFRVRYEGWEMLGRGLLGTVVKTYLRDARRYIAIKVFVNLDAATIDRVRKEVLAAQALSTPYLVRTCSMFDRGTIAWFEMELVEGPNLQQELDRLAAKGDRVPVVRAYEIALALSRCVWDAHRHGILHRDIKPANALLSANGQPLAKVSDFGIAHVTGIPASTPPGTIVGTPQFASPEALAGQPVGPPHDVYSLGMTLYVLFSGGRLPFEGARAASLAALRALRMNARVAPLRDSAPDVDAAVDRLVRKALSPAPQRSSKHAGARGRARAGPRTRCGYEPTSRCRALAVRMEARGGDLRPRACRTLEEGAKDTCRSSGARSVRRPSPTRRTSPASVEARVVPYVRPANARITSTASCATSRTMSPALRMSCTTPTLSPAYKAQRSHSPSMSRTGAKSS